MVKEGKFIEDEFALEYRIYSRHYPTFECELVIGEYDVYEAQNTFFEDFKKAFEYFITSFNFFKLGRLNLVGRIFSKNDILYTETGVELAYKVFENYDESKIPIVFNDPDPEEVLAIFFGLEYQSIKGEIHINDQTQSVSFAIEKMKGSIRLTCGFRWGSGAEWFYNKYQKENREIVRKAIIDFYESSPNYQELKIGYYLYLFDLEIEKYTHKKVIARKNDGDYLTRPKIDFQ